jgi:hypothetical protein
MALGDVLADIRIHRRLREIRLRGQYEDALERKERQPDSDDLTAAKRALALGMPVVVGMREDSRPNVIVRRRQIGTSPGVLVSAGLCPPAQNLGGPTAALCSPQHGVNVTVERQGYQPTARPVSEQAQAPIGALPAGTGVARGVPGQVGQIGGGERPGRHLAVGSRGQPCGQSVSGQKPASPIRSSHRGPRASNS